MEAEDGDAERREELLAEGAGGNADGSLASARAFENAADGAEVLHGAGEIAVAGARAGEIFEAFEFVVAVNDFERDRAAKRDAVPDAGADVDRVGFNALATAATVAALAAAEFDVDRFFVDRHAGGKAVEERDERFAVRFASGPVAEHELKGGRWKGDGGNSAAAGRAMSRGETTNLPLEPQGRAGAPLYIGEMGGDRRRECCKLPILGIIPLEVRLIYYAAMRISRR